MIVATLQLGGLFFLQKLWRIYLCNSCIAGKTQLKFRVLLVYWSTHPHAPELTHTHRQTYTLSYTVAIACRIFVFIHSPKAWCTESSASPEQSRAEGCQKSRITATRTKMQEQQQQHEHEREKPPTFQHSRKANETRTRRAIRSHDERAHTTYISLSHSHSHLHTLSLVSPLLLCSGQLVDSLLSVSSFSCVCQPQQRSSRRKGFSICCRHF